MAVTVPANIAGLALIQCRMVAGILHLRGYDLEDARVRTAILACLLGEERILNKIKKHELPGTPMEIANTLVHDRQPGRPARQRGRLGADRTRGRRSAWPRRWGGGSRSSAAWSEPVRTVS